MPSLLLVWVSLVTLDVSNRSGSTDSSSREVKVKGKGEREGGRGRRGEGAVCAREGERCGEREDSAGIWARHLPLARGAPSTRPRRATGAVIRVSPSAQIHSRSSRARVFERRPVAREQNARVLIGPSQA